MAQIPTYVYIGGDSLLGGAQPDLGMTPPFGSLWGQFMAKANFSRVVPSGADGWTAPTDLNFSPQWDGSLNGGNGAWTRYSYVVGLPGAGNGDNWFWTPTDGFGITAPRTCITPYTLWMAGLWKRHQQGFKSIKFAVPGSGYGAGAGGLWRAGGSALAAFTLQWQRAVTAMGNIGDVPVVKAVITDAAIGDIQGNASSDYLSAVRSHIDAIVALLNPEKVIVVSHRADYSLVNNPLQATAISTLNRQLPNIYPGLVYPFTMEWAKFGPDGLLGGVFPGPNRVTYETEDYVMMGERLIRFLDAISATDTVPDTVSDGIAVHVIIGDSMVLSAGMNPEMIFFSNQGSFLGSDPGGGTQLEKAYTFNGINEMVELYDVLYNTTTMGTTFDYWGIELTAQREMLKDFPRVLLFKVAIAGAALTNPLQQSALEDIRTKWNACKAAAVRDLNAVLVCKALTVAFGTNDSYFDSSAAQFVNAAPGFVDDLRSIFTTDPLEKLSTVWIEPAPHRDSGVLGGSTQGLPTARATVRAAVRSLETSRPRVKVLKDDGGKYELQREPDLQHWGMEAVLQVGKDVWALHRSQLFDEGETEVSTIDAPSETATFVVEDGTGLANANSLCSVASADEYHASNGNPSAWSLLSLFRKQDCLRQASRWVSLRHIYFGERLRSGQSMAFPRVGLTSDDGYPVGSNLVPAQVSQAVAIVALRIAKGDWTPFPDEVPPSSTGSSSISVGPISFSESGGAVSSSQSTETRLPAVTALLRPFLKRATTLLRRG